MELICFLNAQYTVRAVQCHSISNRFVLFRSVSFCFLLFHSIPPWIIIIMVIIVHKSASHVDNNVL